MADNVLKINKIPSLTWNWLKMNEAEVPEYHDAGDEQCSSPTELQSATELRSPANKQSPTDITVPASVAQEAKDAAYADDIKGALGDVFDKKLQANVEETVVFKAEKDTFTEAPVKIVSDFQGGCAYGKRFVIEAEENSEITVLNFFSSEDKVQGRACVQTLVRAAKGAKVHLVQIDRLGNEFELLNDVGAVLDDDAQMSVVHIFLGGKNIYQGCNIDLKGERSSVKKDIGYFLNGEQELDMNYVVLHKGKKTECDIKASGVLEGSSSKLFRGTIDFQNGCAGSKGAEIEEVILRDDTVANKTIPVILCAEEDVEGSHGASIGRLDEDLIFYMQTRGFEEEEIYKLISKSRLLSFCSKIPDEDIRNKTMNF